MKWFYKIFLQTDSKKFVYSQLFNLFLLQFY